MSHLKQWTRRYELNVALFCFIALKRQGIVLVCMDMTLKAQVGPGESRKFSPSVSISKALPSTGFPHCDNIQLGYSVHAVAKVKWDLNT